MIRAAAVAAAVVIAAASAPAIAGGDGATATATKVFPLGGTLRGDLAGAPGAVTSAIATALDAEVAAVGIDDAAGVLGCGADDPACLDAIARSMAAGTMVFGTVAAADGGAIVTLVRYARDEAVAEQTFPITGATPDELAAALLAEASVFLGLPPATDADPPAVDPVPTALPDPETPPAPTAKRGTPGYVWGVIAGGAVVAGVGGGFLLSARSLRGEVANAPTTTREDFDRLTALEAKGRRRTQIGGALAIAGGAAVITGVVLAIVYGRHDHEARDARTVRVEPALIPGGAMLVLSIGAP